VPRKKVRHSYFSVSARRRAFVKKGISALPHLFTLGNAFFAFLSIVLASRGEFIPAAYCILFGALMDALDGRVARFMKLTSELGVHLDSLCDALSFCLAPAFLVYNWHLKRLGFIGVVIAAFYVCFGVLRLARFALIHEKQTLFFLGLPTTVAGCFIVTVLLNVKMIRWKLWTIEILGVLVVVLAFLMVSSLPFPTFKKRLPFFDKKWKRVVGIPICALMAIMRFHMALFVAFGIYFASALYYMLEGRKNKMKKKVCI